MFIPSTFKRPVSSWKALNLRKTLLMASSVRLKPLNCSRSEERFSRNAETDLVCRLLLEKKKYCSRRPIRRYRGWGEQVMNFRARYTAQQGSKVSFARHHPYH